MNKIIKNFKNIKYGPAPEDDSEVLKWINRTKRFFGRRFDPLSINKIMVRFW
jgi:hypothetical protein